MVWLCKENTIFKLYLLFGTWGCYDNACNYSPPYLGDCNIILLVIGFLLILLLLSKIVAKNKFNKIKKIKKNK